ncbi:MAG: PDZ domain-containing protein [Spartobacteria bacterium]|nr:PDZ domain-containing protein [Spartobacteria bacterium]
MVAWGVCCADGVSRCSPVVEVVQRVAPAVVNIGTEKLIKLEYAEPERRKRGEMIDKVLKNLLETSTPPGYRLKHSLGSGVIINKEGYILTNYHVVERATRIHVTLMDDTMYDAIMVAGDEASDLALIKIEPDRALPTVVFVPDAEAPLLGETVVVIGNPYGLAHTVSAGVLSAANREARYEGEVIYNDILQTDAAVNPGSSGGPLLNIDGQVMGISVAVSEEGQNIGFAAPARRVMQLLDAWCSPRFIQKNWLGLELQERNDALWTTHIYSNSPAAMMGIKVNDQIHTINDEPLSSVRQYGEWLMQGSNNAPVRIGFLRDEEVIERQGHVQAAPRMDPRPVAEKQLGLALADPLSLPYRTSAYYLKGIPIVAVVPGGVADREGIRAEQWLSRINDMDLQTLEDAGFALYRVAPGDTVTLVIVDVRDMGGYAVAHSDVHEVTAE